MNHFIANSRPLLLPAVATVVFAALLLHRSESPVILGRYSADYALLITAYALNLALLWRRSLHRLPSPRPTETPASSLLPNLAVLLIPVLFFLDFSLGTRSLRPSHWITLVLLSVIPFQLERLRNRCPIDLPEFHSRLVLAIILLGVLGLRLSGIDFGLPRLYFDEIFFVNIAGRMLFEHDLNPHWFGHPGTTTIYMLCGLYALIFRLGVGLGLIASPADYETFFFQNPTVFYLSGRLVIAALGVATILLTYGIASRLFNRTTALLAATLLALSPLHILASLKIRTDIPLTFFILVAFWFSLSILQRRTWTSYALAGLFTGLSAATKYPAVIFSLALVQAHILGAPRWWKASKLLLCGFAAFAGIFLASPFLFLDFETTLADMALEAKGKTPDPGEGVIRNLLWYLGPLTRALMPSGAVLAAAGLIFCGVSRRRDRWLLASFPALFLIFIAFLNGREEHWTLPAIPFLCVLTACGIYQAAHWIGRRRSPGTGVWAGLLLVIGIGVPLSKASISQDRQLSLPDTRTLAGQWMVENIPAGSRVLLENGTPQLPEESYHFFLVEWEGGFLDVAGPAMLAPERRATTSVPSRVYARKGIEGAVFVPYGHVGRLNDPEAIRRAGVEYMVLGDAYDRYLARGIHYHDSAVIAAVYDSLMHMGTKIYEQRPVRGRIGGPAIRVYRMNGSDSVDRTLTHYK